MKDPYTDEEFKPKRSNQRFANSINRIRYNNNKANEIRKAKAYVDKPLSKNFTILKEIMRDKKRHSVHIEFLRGRGFKFEVFTSMCNVHGTQGFCIYDYLLTYKDDYATIIQNNRP